MKEYKKKPKMMIRRKRGKVANETMREILEERAGARPRKILKKIKPKTRNWKDGKEVTYSKG